jgi:hypothetical protein
MILRTKSSPILDGRCCLADVLKRAGYSTTTQAVAEYAVFLHPETVAQTHGRNLFLIVRNDQERGNPCEKDGISVIQCDNDSPTRGFLWSAGRAGTSKDRTGLWFCHVWQRSQDYLSYTALWNICAIPEFLAALSDKDADVRAVLRYRAFELYGAFPHDEGRPEKPPSYAELSWRQPHPAALKNLEDILRARLRACPKSRAAISAGRLGWLFSDFRPDAEFAEQSSF